MAKNYFNRYVWLIDTVNLHGPITLEKISKLWQQSALNDTGDPLAERTFHNHRLAIAETMGIDIVCDRSRGYYIANSEELGGDGIRSWLLESMSLNNLLNESADMRHRILFEKIPSSQKWLPVIVNAMRSGKAVEVTYQSFNRNEPNTFVVHPYCLKLFRQRWYMLGRSEEYETPRIYSLDDRMLNVAQTGKKLKVPAGFNAQEFFSGYFGIIVGTDCRPSTVDIRVRTDQVKYFESLPLHASQTVIETTPEYTVFRYHMVPTFDFKQELLGRGPTVKVLSPEWFRDEIAVDIKEMAKQYD